MKRVDFMMNRLRTVQMVMSLLKNRIEQRQQKTDERAWPFVCFKTRLLRASASVLRGHRKVPSCRATVNYKANPGNHGSWA